jgi:PAS domain S-box-containing protein
LADPTRIRWILALLAPLIALGTQLLLSPIYKPSFWFLFYPAVFLSSWLGGLRAAVVASALSAVAALWFFAAPERAFVKEPGQYLPAVVFLATGIIFGVFHDRLRKASGRTARALAESEAANHALKRALDERQLFAALIENSSDFIGIADPTGKPIYLNPAGRRMVGLSPDHPIENTQIPEYYPADQRAFAVDVIVGAMIEKGQWQGETCFRNWQTEEPIPVSDTHFMIRRPETSEVIGMGTITRDISEIKRARDDADRAGRELQHAKDAIASLVEQAPDGIFVADLSGRYTDVNGAGCRMLGYTREEILGKTILDLIPAEEARRLEDQKQQMLAGEINVSEWTLRRKDGSYLPVEVSAAIGRDGR